MLNLELYKSQSGNLHLTFWDSIHGKDVDIKVHSDGSIHAEGLVPAEGHTTIFNVLECLLEREAN
jgi:hypothetical protein